MLSEACQERVGFLLPPSQFHPTFSSRVALFPIRFVRDPGSFACFLTVYIAVLYLTIRCFFSFIFNSISHAELIHNFFGKTIGSLKVTLEIFILFRKLMEPMR